MNGAKSYANSYLYTRIPNYEKSILEFVMKADRIEKNNPQFTGIIEDVKRRQTSAVISRVLMRDDVVLAIYNKPLPAAFKVFACKDVKEDATMKIFVDCTGLIKEKNGYLVCDKIDVLNTYLFGALNSLCYYKDNIKVTNSSTLLQSGTECFVNLASHIFDYFRPNGYSENKNKIAYILAMYFQVNLMSQSREDTSVRNLAAKISGIQLRDVNAMEIYYSDEDIVNIDTLVTSIANTFKMKGIDTSVFVEKWTWFYGTGTQFATELFPAFATMITNAFCGSYVNNQKSIEKCCGRAMVTFANGMLRVAGDVLEGGFHYESSLDRECGRKAVHESIASTLKTKQEIHRIEKSVTNDDLCNPNKIIKIVNKLCDLKSTDKEKSAVCHKYFMAICAMCDDYISGNRHGYDDHITKFLKATKKHYSTKHKDHINDYLVKITTNLSKMIAEKNMNIKNMEETKKVLKDAQSASKVL